MKSKRRDSQTSVNRLAVDPDRPDPAVIETAAGILRRGGVVVFPTRCLYGLAADALNPAAVARVFALKRRPAANPILVLVQDCSGVAPLVRRVTPATATKRPSETSTVLGCSWKSSGFCSTLRCVAAGRWVASMISPPQITI